MAKIDKDTSSARAQKRGLVPPPDSKVCYVCMRDLSGKEFFRDRTASDGFSTRCKECQSARAKAYRTDNAAAVKVRLQKHGQTLIGRFNIYKKNASYRGLDWDLNIDQVDILFSGICHYCGGVKCGIDRVDNNVGYIIDNCVPCCTICNLAKRNLNVDEFQKWAGNLAGHRYEKKIDSIYQEFLARYA